MGSLTADVNIATITLCVCVCVCVFLFLHLTAMYSCTFGKGWVGTGCLYFLVRVSFGSF